MSAKGGKKPACQQPTAAVGDRSPGLGDSLRHQLGRLIGVGLRSLRVRLFHGHGSQRIGRRGAPETQRDVVRRLGQGLLHALHALFIFPEESAYERFDPDLLR